MKKSLKSLLLVAFMASATALVGCNNNQTSTPASTQPSVTTPQPSVTPSVDPAILEGQKTAAITEVENYKNKDDYRDTEKTQLETLIANTKNAINQATSKTAIDGAVTQFKASADALKTNAQYEAEEFAAYKATKISEVENYKDKNDYRDEEKAQLEGLINAAKTAINDATSREVIDGVVTTFKTNADALKTNAQHEAEEFAAYKETKVSEVEGYKTATDYRETEQTQLATLIQTAKASINNATTKDEINNAVTEFKTAADALKTKAQYEAEEAQALADAIVAAVSEIENYVNPINYRKAQETQVLDLIDEYYAKVQAATSIDNVNAIVTEFKGLVDAIPVDTGFTGALEKGAIVSFTKAANPTAADLFIKPDTNNWTGDGFAIRIKNTCGAQMFINVYLNETDSDRVHLATGASFYLYDANGKSMATSGRTWGYYMLVPHGFDGYVYIPYDSMELDPNYGGGNKSFNYSSVYGLYLETAVECDDYQIYEVGEVQVLNGDTITTVVSTSDLTSRNYSSKYVKDFNGEYINTRFNGEEEPEETCIFSGSLTGSEISFNSSSVDQLSALKLSAKNNNWAGDGFAIRMKELAGKLSYISMFINETDGDIACLKANATYSLYNLDGTVTEGSNNRGWGSYLTLPANFDGYVYFPYSSFAYNRGAGDNNMTYTGIWGVYFEINTFINYGDFNQHFIIGSIEVKNGDTVTKVLDTTTLTNSDYTQYVEKAGNNENINQSFYSAK